MVKFKDYSVLIVEDDEIVRESFSGCLKMLFKKVDSASNGEDGFKAWNTHSPDILITDIYMPQMDGIELAKLVREQDSKIPIVFMSSHSDPQTFIKTMPISADGFIAKPFSFESCLETLQKCVKKIEQKLPYIIRIKGGASVNVNTRSATYNNIISTLAPQEFKLLTLFIDSLDTTLHQSVISSALWNGESKSPSALKNLLLRMRKKLGPNSIDTLIGHGYRLNIIS